MKRYVTELRNDLQRKVPQEKQESLNRIYNCRCNELITDLEAVRAMMKVYMEE